MAEERENIQSEETKQERKPKKRFVALVAAVALVVAGAFFVRDMLMYQSTDDAYVETVTVQVAPRVSGHISEVYIKDNQAVKAGTPIAKIDAVDYEVALAKKEAIYEKTLLDQNNAKAGYVAAKTNYEVAKKDLERYTNLYKEGAVSKQTLDVAQAKFDVANANLTKAEQAVLSEAGDKVADAHLREVKADRDKAKLDVKYTDIVAPQDGTISGRRVEKGMYVNVGTPLCTIVPNEVWVVANFKENQLRHMKLDQEVEIKIDTYPNKVFKGKVESIQRASGAKSSLFPPENAVGSFVKIVQRIPVKIVFAEDIDTNEFNIIPGMSVVPKVKVK